MPNPTDEPDRLARTLGWAVPVGGGLLFVALWLAYRDFWLDDAFITFRYARNLAEGKGPVFNPGEAVEGYTSFLWMLATSASFALLDEVRALFAIKTAGLVLGLITLWRCFTFPSPTGDSRARLLILLLAANPVFVANCGDGLETPLFMALLVECARAFVAPPSPRSGVRLGLLTAAAIWTRPEALPLLVLWPLLWAIARSNQRLAPALAGFGLSSLPLVLGHIAWRLAYYGAPFPNSFYAKATGQLAARLAAGGANIAEFTAFGVGVPPLGVWLAGVLALIASLHLLRAATPGVRAWLLGLWSLVAFRFAFDVWSGSEFMGTFRFLAPALPPLFVLADEGVRSLTGPASRRVARFWLGAAVSAALAAALFGNARLAETHASYEQGLEEAHIALGEWLRETSLPGTWVALGDSGAIPFYSRLPVLDLWGLADATISRLPGEYGNRPGTANYVLGRRPGIIVLWNLVPIRNDSGALRLAPAQPFDREIADHPAFLRSYRFVREFTFSKQTGPPDGYYLEVFERRPNTRPRLSS